MYFKIALLVFVVLTILSQVESKNSKRGKHFNRLQKTDGKNGRIEKFSGSGENGKVGPSVALSKTRKRTQKFAKGKRLKGKPKKGRPGRKRQGRKRGRKGKMRRNKFGKRTKKNERKKNKCAEKINLNSDQIITDEHDDKKKKKCKYQVTVDAAAVITLKCQTFNFPENCKQGATTIKEGKKKTRNVKKTRGKSQGRKTRGKRKGRKNRVTKRGKNKGKKGRGTRKGKKVRGKRGGKKYCGSGSWEYSTSGAVTSLKISTKGKQYDFSCTLSKGSGSGSGNTSATTSQPGGATNQPGGSTSQPGAASTSTTAAPSGYNWCLNHGSDNTMCKYKGVDGAKCTGLFGRNTISSADKDLILAFHNQHRQKVSAGTEGLPEAKTTIPDLKWDDTLSEVAQRWADQCTWGHDTNRNTATFSYVGQNMYMAWGSAKPSTVAWKASIDSWYSEIKDYIAANQDVNNFQSVSGPAIGHFTQVVWAATTHVGCGYVEFEKDNGYTTHIACNYGPGGNIIGQPIYVPK